MEPLNNGGEEKKDKIQVWVIVLGIFFYFIVLPFLCFISITLCRILIGKAIILFLFFSFLGFIVIDIIRKYLELSDETKKNKSTAHPFFRFFEYVATVILRIMLLWILFFELNVKTLGEPYLARAKVRSVNVDNTFFSSSTKLYFRKGFVGTNHEDLKNADYMTAWLCDGKFGLTFFRGIYSIGTSIKGRVCSNYKNYKYPLVRVSVTECDSSGRVVNAIFTDAEGNFSMDVKNTNNYLVISKAGYKTMKLKIGSYRNFNIELSMTP